MKRRNISPTPAAAPRRKERRGLPWGKLFLLGLVCLFVLAWFAPTLIVKSGFRDQLLGSALKDFPGKVLIGSASAGWLSPVEVTNVAVTNTQGEEIATVASVRTEKNLLSLALDHQEIGKIVLQQPKLALKLRPDGSNLEDLITPLMKNLEGKESSGSIGYSIEIVDGSVEATYAGSEGKWRFEKLNANVAMPRDKASPLTATIKTDVIADGAAPGNLAADVQWQSEPKGADPNGTAGFGQGSATIQSTNLPLDIVTLASRRAGLDLQLSGLITTDTALTVTEKSQTINIKTLAGQNLFVASPSLLGADQLQLAALTGSGEISRSANDWQFRAVTLQSDVATLSATGAGPTAGTASLGAGLARAFRAGNWDIRGNLDVAKLAATIPNTLHLRSGTHVSSGQVVLSLVSQAAADSNVWNAEVQADQLAAIHAGSAMEWKKPIVLKAAVRELPAGIMVDQLTCDSSFLQLSGAGTLEQGKFVLDGDLSQFVNEVGRFVDLGDVRAAGKFHSQVDWKNNGNSALSLTGNGSATNFELTYAADRPWQEQQLEIQFSSDAKISSGQITQVDRGDLRITAAGDNLEAQLLAPVKDITSSTTWPCHLRVQGDLGRWLARLQMFVSLDGWQIGGDDIQFEGDVQASMKRVELANSKGTIKNFLFNGSGLTILEPIVQIETTATYDLPTGELISPDTTIVGSTVSLRAREVRMVYNDQTMALEGDVKYRTDLERLSSWFRDARQPATYRLQGKAEGEVRLTYANGATRADATAAIDNCAYATPVRQSGLAITPVNQSPAFQNLWNEPRLELAVIGTLDASGQQAVIEKLEIAGDSLSVGAAGSVRQPFGRCELDVSGEYAYDLERLAQRFQGVLGPQVQMRGTGQRPFTFRGPLMAANPSRPAIRNASNSPASAEPTFSLQEMLAEISVGWQNLSIQGFEIGPGEVATKLERGFMTFSPIDLPVSEGKVAITPTVDVNRTPYIATLQPGTIVDRVRISPEMCRSWLKYLAPLAANATNAEGHFSVTLDEAKFPVSDPTGGNIRGKLVIHSAQIGPGPLSQEILNVVQLVQNVINKQPLAALGAQQTTSQWLDMPQQQLTLELADHKVRHQDMQFTVDGVEVRTSGWVGLDQQIALVAIVPVRDEWVSKDRYLASLKGQTIRLPINGTLSRPQLDRTALRQLTTQAATGVITNEVQERLGREINKFLPPGFGGPQK